MLNQGKSRPDEVQAPLKYCLYARKSTEEDERQALSIESQVKEMRALAEREGLEVVDERREAHSAKDSGQRPEYNRLIADVRAGTFNAILTWAPDRLSRNAGDLGALVDLMDQGKLVGIRTYGQKFSNSPNEKFLLMILGSQAKLENDNKSVNVKRGLRALVEGGLWPGPAPTGYLSEMRTDRKGHVMADPKRGPVIRKMFEKVADEGWSGRQVFRWLNDSVRFTTKTGKGLSLANIYMILQSHFYHGTFEYPKGSDCWYKGRHEPLIDKELFDRVQARLKRDNIQRSPDAKDFAFTKLMRCGGCGAGITAEQKSKTLKDGTVARYVYYVCSKNRIGGCGEKYIREDDLIEQLAGVIDGASLDELGMRAMIEKEMEQYRRFRRGVMGVTDDKSSAADVDAKRYVKFILHDGTVYEKRELLMHLRSRLVLTDRRLTLAAE
jgi:DNA invertase Pin-like site-specific DNA recombinase